MTDLDFTGNSITETAYGIAYGKQPVAVEDSDWLELFTTTTTPAS